MEREAPVTGVEARGRGHPRLETASKRAHPLPSQLPLPGHGWHGLGGRLAGQEVGVVLVVKMAVCRSSQVVLFFCEFTGARSGVVSGKSRVSLVVETANQRQR